MPGVVYPPSWERTGYLFTMSRRYPAPILLPWRSSWHRNPHWLSLAPEHLECQGTWSWTGATSRGPAPALQGAEAARPVAPSAPGLPTAAATLPGTLSLATQAAASPVQAVAPLQVSGRQEQP